MKRMNIKLGIGLTAVILVMGGGFHLYNRWLASVRPNYDDPNVQPRTAVNSAGQSKPWEVVQVTDGDTKVIISALGSFGK